MHKLGLLLCAAIGVLAAWTILGGLGREPLAAYDEGTYAQVVHESFERGDFVRFTLFDKPWFEKPPLYFWLAGAATWLTGDPVLGIRLPAAVFGVAVVALVMYLAYRATGEYAAAAFAGAFLLAIDPFVQGAREARLDLLVAFFILLAYWAAWQAVVKPAKSRWLILYGAAAGLAVLSKSVVAVFAVAALPLWALWLGDWGVARDKRVLWGVLVAFAIAAPWHLYQWWRWGGAFWADYAGYHVFERYETNLFGDPGLQTDYLARLWEQAQAPLVVCVVALCLLPLVYKSARAERAPLVVALSMAASMALLFFSAETRALSYLIPMYPFAALFVALTSGQLLRRAQKGVIR